MDYVFWFNVFETILWTVLGIGCLILALSSGAPGFGRRLVLMALFFWLFAASEVVETQTGAWWKPWWLAVWKGGCIAVLLLLGRQHLRHRRSRPEDPPSDQS